MTFRELCDNLTPTTLASILNDLNPRSVGYEYYRDAKEALVAGVGAEQAEILVWDARHQGYTTGYADLKAACIQANRHLAKEAATGTALSVEEWSCTQQMLADALDKAGVKP